jgi:L-ribulose-5-phosphate 4-epimerase
VRGHHRGIFGLAIEQAKRREIHLGVGLVTLGELCGEHGVNAKVGELEQIGEQRDVAVRQCGGDVPAAQAIEPFSAVRPRPELPPAPDEPLPAAGRKADVVLGQHAGQRLALEGIEIAPPGAQPNPVHRGLVRATPVVDDGRPVGLDAGAGRGALGDVDQAGPPVHERSEDVEQQDTRRFHGVQYVSASPQGEGAQPAGRPRPPPPPMAARPGGPLLLSPSPDVALRRAAGCHVTESAAAAGGSVVMDSDLVGQVVDIAQRVVASGAISANGHGNVSVRVPGAEEIYFTAGPSLRNHPAAAVVRLGLDGSLLEGELPPIQGAVVAMHTAMYADNPDVGCVLHTHSPYATAYAVAHRPIGCWVEALAMFGLADGVPVAGYRPRGSDQAVASIRASVIPGVPAVLLANHGVLVFHRTPDLAIMVGGIVEEAAQAGINADGLGGPVEIPAELRAAALQRAMTFDSRGTVHA